MTGDSTPERVRNFLNGSAHWRHYKRIVLVLTENSVFAIVQGLAQQTQGRGAVQIGRVYSTLNTKAILSRYRPAILTIEDAENHMVDNIPPSCAAKAI